MKLLCKKRTYLFLSLILIIGGMLVGICGFGMAHFDPNQLPQDGNKPWYQTIAIANHSWWFGVQFPSGAITSGVIPIK